MCGIAGVVALGAALPPPRVEAVAAMVATLRHRGPDELGVYRDAHAALGHARLSIVDVEAGQQPMSNEAGKLWTVFNGEIFNHVELRAELEALGYRFRTRSDTEVVVHAFEAWGGACFERFNGQFAIALWDAAREVLVLARDPLGVQPLYVCEHGGRTWFASELKAIFAGDADLPRQLDPAGLAETFTFWSVVPPQSIFQGVTELEPGHVRTIRREGARDRAFWEPAYPIGPAGGFAGSIDDAVDEVRAALDAAVRLRVTRADVPVGSYLSGGLDSSLVAAMGRRIHGEGFRTFSLRFEDQEYDETHWQRAVVARIGTEHRELIVRRRDIAEVFPDVVEHAERPLLRAAPAPLFLLSRFVRAAGIKVVLTGEGADEMFAGYDLFREAKVRRFWGRAPGSAWRPRLLARLYPWLERSPVSRQAMAREFFGPGRQDFSSPGFSHQPRWRSTAALHRLFAPGLREAVRTSDVVVRLLRTLPPDYRRWSPLSQDQYLEARTLLSGYLLSSQGDRMLMAHSVEGRFPFLDPSVVALASALPPSYKLHVLDEKHVLKRVARGLLPDAIARRPKQPYRAPDATPFVDPAAPEWVRAVTDERALRDAGVFAPEAVAQVWRKCQARAGAGPLSNTDNMAIVGVVSTQVLHDRFVRRRPPVSSDIPLRTVVDRLSTRAYA